MKKVYETPTIEYDDFELDSLVCANLYGSNHNKRSTEFYAIGGGGTGLSSSDERTMKDAYGSFDNLGWQWYSLSVFLQTSYEVCFFMFTTLCAICTKVFLC